ncbi:M15 family metallopeptidase [Tropicibacter naphthalenivorans]|uniref:Peptidase M15C domain-containing protein n=1 Tax=Tropicibacter naphthalenivorans TaxID=441103 RepID=A0A0P1G371_9RHOB|nr:M15 family metallopeptidase [Tropicibacter naphthalenivorans]CUH76152.1 hypothetical protein TRN7648_00807 [Tropicibacter naphthalenivorans]SMC39658.1 D-alanyl-D-alanine carboxypeptidase [Tropicibacter naphthalenivorans]
MGKTAILMAALFAGQAAWAERGTQSDVPDAMWQRMQGVSWHEGMGCPARATLRLLTVPFNGFDGAQQLGQMIVAGEVAAEVLDIFDELHQAGFPIERMQPVHMFLGKDDLSMAANNTSAFNCRVVGGTTRLSQHAFGTAMDINPVQNPYVTSGGTSPAAGKAFDEAAERTSDVQGIIRAGDPVVSAFKARGWGWGGDWQSLKDYQHFSRSGH